MRFTLTTEQEGFARSVDDLLSGSDVPAAVRSWRDGDPAAGLAVWDKLADLGVMSLASRDSGATPADLVVAFEQLGRHVVPGPCVEAGVLLPALTGHDTDGIATVGTPLALDADVADATYLLTADALLHADAGVLRPSIDPSRRLFEVSPGAVAVEVAPATVAAGIDLATLAVAAELVGAGNRVLEDAATYAKARVQFGKPIGQQQAIKHQLANAKVALDFARPLVWGAALDPTPQAVSAAKVRAGDAAYLAARVALQVHGAIGYTQEYDLSLWLLRIRALRSAWGTGSYHRGRVLDALTGGS